MTARLPASTVLLATAVALAAGPAPAISPPPPPAVLVETDRARVVGPPGATALASTVAGLVDAAVPRIAPAVGADDLSPIRVYIYLDRARFLQATGAPAHATIVGLAVMPAGAIHIDGTGRLASIASVVPHEVAHIMIARATGPALQALPRWVNEGMAEYLSDEPAARVDPAALRAVGRGEAIALSDLDAALARGDRRTELAYVEAASLVHFVVAQKGDQSLRALLGAIRQSGDFDAALKRATGWTPAQLESAWRASLSRRWRWPLLFESPLPVFGLMVLLFVVGLARHLRRRRRRQELPEDDW